MYQQLKKIVHDLQESNGEVLDFKYEVVKGKSFEAKIFLTKSNPGFEIKSINGYSHPTYITRKFKKELFSAYNRLPTPKTGDVARLLSDNFPDIQLHQSIILDSGFRYFSLQDQYGDTHLDCTGERSEFAFEAICVRTAQYPEKCFAPDSDSRYYIKFLLKKKIG